MEPSSIIALCNGVRLASQGNTNLEKTGYRVRDTGYICPWWVSKNVTTDQEAALFAASMAWHGIYHKALEESVAIPIYQEWKERFYTPSLSYFDLSVDNMDELKWLIKDKDTGPELLKMVKTGRVHFITFCYLDAVCGLSNRWKESLHYKIVKQKFQVLKNVVGVDKERALQFFQYMNRHFVDKTA